MVRAIADGYSSLTHMYVTKTQVGIGSDNGLSIRRQAII